MRKVGLKGTCNGVRLRSYVICKGVAKGIVMTEAEREQKMKV